MPRNRPIHASQKTLNRVAYDEWLHPTYEGDDPTMLDHTRDIIEKRLSARDREVLLAAYYERLSYRELAERFNFNNKGSAWFAVQRAMKQLRKHLGDIYE